MNELVTPGSQSDPEQPTPILPPSEADAAIKDAVDATVRLEDSRVGNAIAHDQRNYTGEEIAESELEE